MRGEYVRGALFSSVAHTWDYMTGVARVSDDPQSRIRVYGAIVWRKRRRYVKP